MKLKESKRNYRSPIEDNKAVKRLYQYNESTISLEVLNDQPSFWI